MHYAYKSLLIILVATSCNNILSQFYDPGNTIYTLSPTGNTLSHYHMSTQEEKDDLFLGFWLCIAIWQKDAIKAKEFLDKGADPNWPFRRAQVTRDEGTPATPLWIAVANNQPNLVKLLLDYGAIPSQARAYADRSSFSSVASIIENRYYLKNIPQEILNRVIFRMGWPYGGDIFKMAADVGNKEIIQLLNDYASGKKQPTRSFTATQTSPIKPYQPTPTPTGPQPTTGQPVKPQPPGPQKTSYQQAMSTSYPRFGDAKFWMMAYVGDIDEFQSAVQLAQQKGLVNNLYQSGAGRTKMTALSAALLRKDGDVSADQYLNIIKILLQAGADPNIPNQDNQPPLLAAVYTKAPITYFEALLNAGANPKITDEKGTTPLINLITDENIKNLVQQYQSGVKQPSGTQAPTPTMTPLQTNLNALANELNKLASAI